MKNIIEKRFYILVLALILLFIMFIDGFFILDQRNYAIVFQFGEAIRVEEEPGLKLKFPFINNIEYLDKRILNIDSVSKELTTADSKRIIIDSFAKFEISDPLLFYKKMNNKNNGERLLEATMRQVIGKIQLTDLFSKARVTIMKQIKESINIEAKNFGIRVIDVRIVHADFPEENSKSIHKRMETERIKESTQIRAEGSQIATEMIANTDRQADTLLATARRDAAEIKAAGDREATKIYADSYSKDYEFFKFYRNLETYNKINSQAIIISPDSSLMLESGFGK